MPKKNKRIPLVFVLILIFFTALAGFFFFTQEQDQSLPQENPAPAGFTIVVLPDTQHYSRNYPAIFQSQTQWVVANEEKENIVFLTHLGDIVDSQTLDFEWKNADQAMSLLDGIVPYGLSIGNHDDKKKFNQYFPVSRFEDYSWYGGHYGQGSENNYQFFQAEGLEFIIFHLEYLPADKVLLWADKILEQYPEKRAIVTSHACLDYAGYRDGTGQRIFDQFKDNENWFLLLCGHIHAEAHQAEIVAGRPFYQLLADYQDRVNGGNGLLRLLRFVPDENKIYVRTYSPYTGEYEVDENSEFELDYKMKD